MISGDDNLLGTIMSHRSGKQELPAGPELAVVAVNRASDFLYLFAND